MDLVELGRVTAPGSGTRHRTALNHVMAVARGVHADSRRVSTVLLTQTQREVVLDGYQEQEQHAGVHLSALFAG